MNIILRITYREAKRATGQSLLNIIFLQNFLFFFGEPHIAVSEACWIGVKSPFYQVGRSE